MRGFPLVVWFQMPSTSLTNERRLMVGLSILATPATTSFAFKVGLHLPLFSADLETSSPCAFSDLEGTDEGYV